jgi:hypothetical protein
MKIIVEVYYIMVQVFIFQLIYQGCKNLEITRTYRIPKNCVGLSGYLKMFRSSYRFRQVDKRLQHAMFCKLG